MATERTMADGKPIPKHLRSINTFMPDTTAIPKNIAKEVWYTTATGDSYSKPNDQTCFTTLDEWKGQSLEYLHGPNAYQKYVRSKAPLAQRSWCSYEQQFKPLPLDGKLINKECFDLFKKKSITPSTQCEPGELDGRTTTAMAFPGYKGDPLKNARPPNFKPEIQVHVDRQSQLLEKQSHEKDEFRTFNKVELNIAHADNFKPAIQTHLKPKSIELEKTTSYDRQYNNVKFKRTFDPQKLAAKEKERIRRMSLGTLLDQQHPHPTQSHVVQYTKMM